MWKRLGKALIVLFAGHVILGLGVILALVFAPPLRLGEGGLDSFIRGVELRDFKWWLAAAAIAVWLGPIALVVVWHRARAAGLEVEQFREVVRRLLRDRFVPIQVDVSGRIPVKFDAPLRVPVELHTRVGFDEEVDIEAEIPVRAEIPVDVEVETTVLRFGTIKVPIRANIPVDLVLPIKGRIRIRAQGIPVDLKEEAIVTMPEMEVPVATRIDTRIDLLANFRAAAGLLRGMAGRASAAEDDKDDDKKEPEAAA